MWVSDILDVIRSPALRSRVYGAEFVHSLPRA